MMWEHISLVTIHDVGTISLVAIYDVGTYLTCGNI